MADYTSITVQAYSLSTGKSIQESLVDLVIDRLLDLSEINHHTPGSEGLISSLPNDNTGILFRARGARVDLKVM